MCTCTHPLLMCTLHVHVNVVINDRILGRRSEYYFKGYDN